MPCSLGEGPELRGFRGAPVHRWDSDRGERERRCQQLSSLGTGRSGGSLMHKHSDASSCDSACKKQTKRCPQTGRFETHVAVDRLVRGGTEGVGPLGGLGPARLFVLDLKLLQLQRKMTNSA